MNKSKRIVQYDDDYITISIRIKPHAVFRHKSDIVFKDMQKDINHLWYVEHIDKVKEVNRLRHAEHPEKAAEYAKIWAESNPGRAAENNKSWRLANPGKVRERQRAYYEANSDQAKEYSKAWRIANPEKVAENNKLWRMANPGMSTELSRNWRLNNPDKQREIARRSKSRRKGFGYAPINDPFNGAEFHHTHIDDDHASGIFIPAELHKSVCHSNHDENSMNKINALAFEWLYMQSNNNEVI